MPHFVWSGLFCLVLVVFPAQMLLKPNCKELDNVIYFVLFLGLLQHHKGLCQACIMAQGQVCFYAILLYPLGRIAGKRKTGCATLLAYRLYLVQGESANARTDCF